MRLEGDCQSSHLLQPLKGPDIFVLLSTSVVVSLEINFLVKVSLEFSSQLLSTFYSIVSAETDFRSS